MSVAREASPHLLLTPAPPLQRRIALAVSLLFLVMLFGTPPFARVQRPNLPIVK